MKTIAVSAALAGLIMTAGAYTDQASAQSHGLELDAIGTYATGVFDESAAEIAAHDPNTQRVFVVNAVAGAVDVLDIRDPRRPTRLFSIELSPYGAVVNSVDVRGRVVAVAVENEVKTDPGKVVFFNVNGRYLNDVQVGALPDMLTFTPDGSRVLVANEGEPDDT